MIISLRITVRVFLSQKDKLMISEETTRCRKIKRILRYHLPNKLLSQEKFAHRVLVLIYPSRDEIEFLPFGESNI